MQKRGGVSHSFVKIADTLAERGWDVKIFAGLHGNRHLQQAERVEKIGWKVGKSKNLWKPLLALSRVYLKTKKDLGRDRIVHDTNYYHQYRSIYPNAPYVVTVHDMIGDIESLDSSWSARARARRKAAVMSADAIVSPSQATVDDLLSIWEVDAKRIVVAPHGVSPNPQANRNPPSCPYLVHVGGRKRYKDFATLRKALAQTRKRGHDLGIVCFGESLSKTERQELHANGIPNDRILEENGADEKLAAIYSKAEMLVYQSTYEGFGMPILEAMINQCPVVCSNAAACLETADGATLVAPIRDADAFASQIERLLLDPQEKEKLRKKGLARAQRQSWNVSAEAHERAYGIARENHQKRTSSPTR